MKLTLCCQTSQGFLLYLEEPSSSWCSLSQMHSDLASYSSCSGQCGLAFVPHTHLTIATLFLFFQPLEQAFSQHPGVTSFINVQVSPQVSPSPLSYLKLQFILSLSSYFLHSPHSYFPSFGLPPLISTLTVYLRGWQIGVGQIKLLALHVKFCWHIAWSICL